MYVMVLYNQYCKGMSYVYNTRGMSKIGVVGS